MPGLKNALPLIAAALAAPSAMAWTVATPAAPAPTGPAPIAASVPASAASPTPAPAAPACELHVWPAARVVATTEGVGAGFGALGYLIDAAAHAAKNKRDTAFITGTLDARAQMRVLRELDLPTRLHLPPSQVIFHEQGVDIDHDDPHRLSDSTAQCYIEFVVRGLAYFQSTLARGQMRTFLEVRRFDGAKVKLDFNDSKHQDLDVKLPKEGDDTGPASDALVAAFRGDVAFFADKFARKHK